MTTIAVLDYGSGNLRSAERAIARTGATVVVTDDERIATEADGLVVIVQEAVDILPDDDESTLHERIKVVERRLLVDVVRRIARHGLAVNDRKVTLP